MMGMTVRYTIVPPIIPSCHNLSHHAIMHGIPAAIMPHRASMPGIMSSLGELPHSRPTPVAGGPGSLHTSTSLAVLWCRTVHVQGSHARTVHAGLACCTGAGLIMVCAEVVAGSFWGLGGQPQRLGSTCQRGHFSVTGRCWRAVLHRAWGEASRAQR